MTLLLYLCLIPRYPADGGLYAETLWVALRFVYGTWGLRATFGTITTWNYHLISMGASLYFCVCSTCIILCCSTVRPHVPLLTFVLFPFPGFLMPACRLFLSWIRPMAFNESLGENVPTSLPLDSMPGLRRISRDSLTLHAH